MQTQKMSADPHGILPEAPHAEHGALRRLLARLPQFNRPAIIGTTVLLVISAVALVFVLLLAGLNDSVNVTGRQRMLSQRMAKAVEMVAATAQGGRGDAARQDLAEVMATFEQVVGEFEGRRGDAGRQAAAVRPVWDEFRTGAEQVVAGGDQAAAGLAVVRGTNLKLLAASQALTEVFLRKTDRFKMLAVATLFIGVTIGGAIAFFLWRDGRRQEAQAVAMAAAEAERRAEQHQALLLKTALDGVAVNVMMADRDYNIIYANRATLTTLGGMEAELRKVYPGFLASTLVGKNIDTFHRSPKAVRMILDDPKRLPYTTQIHVGPFILDLVVSPVVDRQGRYVAVIVAWDDVTERATLDEETARIVQGVTDGALDQRVDVTKLRRPESRGQAERLNEMLATIAAPLRRILEATQQVTLSTGEIAAGNQDLAARTEEQAASLEETASAMEEITSTTRATADKAVRANELAATAQRVAEDGGDVVGKAVAAMAAINQSSTRISDIIEVIDEIAFQTNLLSLNAAVEAARAGEQGRGFAVVAAEVRNLARRSAKAAQEIKGLIQDSVGKVAAGTELVNASGASLNGILHSVREVTAYVEDIASASREQSTGIDSVNGAIAQMNTITQQNAALVEQVAASAEALTARARDMEKQVLQFQLGEEPGGGGRHKAAVHSPPEKMAAKDPARRSVAVPAAATVSSDEWEEF